MAYYAPVPASAPAYAMAAPGAYAVATPGSMVMAEPVGMYAPPGAEVVLTAASVVRPWVTGPCDPCGGPDGCNTCCYVTFCTPCAAGDVAKAAGRDYCCSCFIIPVLLPCLAPGHYATDRAELVRKWGIPDDLGCLGSCLCFWLGFGQCLLCQSVTFLKANGWYGGYGAAVGGATTTVILPAQQVMYAAPVVTYQ
jgi:hypothetical protein